jgi:hypothetical protein
MDQHPAPPQPDNATAIAVLRHKERCRGTDAPIRRGNVMEKTNKSTRKVKMKHNAKLEVRTLTAIIKSTVDSLV